MFEDVEFELPEVDLDAVEAKVAAKQLEEQNQAPLEAGDGCEDGACKI